MGYMNRKQNLEFLKIRMNHDDNVKRIVDCEKNVIRLQTRIKELEKENQRLQDLLDQVASKHE